ncbi:hypothetical protein HGRIS_014163 [Hohenbuehelia grisea]|uniref:Glycosyl hydrolase family 95 N-terminal domain-containing protein n=1 Tax=Hohenbuehelia grisea TaxID=104357 RepID=A0ABR3JSP0_9AGAR
MYKMLLLGWATGCPLTWPLVMLVRRLLLTITPWLAPRANSAPAGFPVSGNGLWYEKPGSVWSREFLPVGNGFLAAMTPGGTMQEITQLNIESLWSGGPSADPSYNGGNKQPSEQTAMSQAMQQIRKTIIESPNGEIDTLEVLTTDAGAYGSYASAGNLISTLNSSGTVSNYARWLDLDAAVARTTWTQASASFIRETFCENPTRTCTQRTAFTTRSSSRTLPSLTYAFSPLSLITQGLPTPSISCHDANTLRLNGTVGTPGMAYELLARAGSTGGSVFCRPVESSSSAAANATITVLGASEAWITWVGGTDYNINAGDASHGFAFKGPDPHAGLVSLLSKAPRTAAALLAAHTADVKATLNAFSLSLGAPASKDTLSATTAALVDAYQVDEGHVYLENLLFNYGRYLLWSSARGVLPANLQGKWADGYGNAWSAGAYIL